MSPPKRGGVSGPPVALACLSGPATLPGSPPVSDTERESAAAVAVTGFRVERAAPGRPVAEIRDASFFIPAGV